LGKFIPEDPKTRKRMAVAAALIALLALLSAWGTGRSVASWLALPDGESRGVLAVAGGDSVESGGGVASRSSRALSLRSFLRPIQRRNIFDSSNLGVEPLEGDVEEAGRKSDLDLTLLATLVADGPAASSALIKGDEKDARAYGYAIGERVASDAEIVDIRPRRVILRRDDGSVEYISMEGDKELARRNGSKSGDKDDESGITKLTETSYAVESWFMEEQMQNLDALIAKVRAVPHKGDDGQVDGYRLSAIRRGSILDKLGIKNGDIVHGVNGTGLTSTSGAMGAFQALQSESNFSFDLTRRRQKVSVDYEIR
jgi:general secretion pathway protein C